MLGNILSNTVKTNNKIFLGGVKSFPDCDLNVGYIENVGKIISSADFFPKYIKILAHKTEKAFAKVERTKNEEQSMWLEVYDTYKRNINENDVESGKINLCSLTTNNKRFFEVFVKSQTARKKAKALLAKFKKEYSLWSMETAQKMKNCPEKLSPEFKKALDREDFAGEITYINGVLSDISGSYMKDYSKASKTLENSNKKKFPNISRYSLNIKTYTSDILGIINNTGRILNEIEYEGYNNRWIWLHAENRKRIKDIIDKALKTI